MNITHNNAPCNIYLFFSTHFGYQSVASRDGDEKDQVSVGKMIIGYCPKHHFPIDIIGNATNRHNCKLSHTKKCYL